MKPIHSQLIGDVTGYFVDISKASSAQQVYLSYLLALGFIFGVIEVCHMDVINSNDVI